MERNPLEGWLVTALHFLYSLIMQSYSQEILQKMAKSYSRIFSDTSTLEEIKAVINALQNNKPILQLLESNKGTFSTIFTPFHAGTIGSNGIEWRNENLPSACKKIMENCAHIESLIDDASSINIEPSEEVKNQLLIELQNFVASFPKMKETIEDGML